VPPRKKVDKRVKFTAAKRAKYIQLLRNGGFKFDSANKIGISYRTIQRRMADDDEFKEDIALAMMESFEKKEMILSEMADERDLGALKMWMTAHGRSTYGDRQVLQIDATKGAIEMTANVALAKVSELHGILAEREARMIESGDIIDVASTEETVVPKELQTGTVPDDEFKI